ncbi:MAG: hypothetical protein AAB152_00645 [Candidatus Coatesbacteria bacterium]
MTDRGSLRLPAVALCIALAGCAGYPVCRDARALGDGESRVSMAASLGMAGYTHQARNGDGRIVTDDRRAYGIGLGGGITASLAHGLDVGVNATLIHSVGLTAQLELLETDHGLAAAVALEGNYGSLFTTSSLIDHDLPGGTGRQAGVALLVTQRFMQGLLTLCGKASDGWVNRRREDGDVATWINGLGFRIYDFSVTFGIEPEGQRGTSYTTVFLTAGVRLLDPGSFTGVYETAGYGSWMGTNYARDHTAKAPIFVGLGACQTFKGLGL